jgi:hypothetical protein
MLVFQERLEDLGESFRREQTLLNVFDDECVKFGHGDVPAATNRFSFLVIASTGTRIGMVDETARRRLIVEDLMKAGLSVRMISSVTDIPRSSVHRAMRAIARAEAKKEVAIAEIASQLLGERLPYRRRGRR